MRVGSVNVCDCLTSTSHDMNECDVRLEADDGGVSVRVKRDCERTFGEDVDERMGADNASTAWRH